MYITQSLESERLFRPFISYRLTHTNASLEYFQPELSVTHLTVNQVYVAYNNISRFLVMMIIPLTLLIYWNFNIYRHTKTTSGFLEETLNEQNRRKQETELANVLIGIVIFFIVCHSPRIFISVHEILAYNSVCGMERKYRNLLNQLMMNKFYVTCIMQ